MANTLATEKQAAAIKQRMAEIRTELPYSADIARNRIRQLADWKYHLANRPLPVLAATALAAYLLVPAKRHSSGVAIERANRRNDEREPAKTGLVSGIAGTVATLALKQIVSVAANHLSNSLTRNG